MDPITADYFRCDLDFAQNTVDDRVSAGSTQGTNTSWENWSGYVSKLAFNPLPETVSDKISIIQVFAQRVCTGELAAHIKTI